MWRRVIMLSAAAVALLILIGMALRVPHPPMLVAPPDNTVQRIGTDVEFRWRYGGFVYRHPVMYRRASHFVVCIKEYAPGDFPCSYPQTPDEPPWADTVSGFDSVSGAVNTSLAELIRIYRFQPDQIPADLMGKDLMWTVAACASTRANSCNHAVPARRLKLDNVNLKALAAHVVVFGNTHVQLESSFTNDSMASTGPFDVKIQAAELRIDAAHEPIKDLTTIAVNQHATNEVMLKNGQIHVIADFTAAGGDPDDVRGILVKNGFREERSTMHPGLGPGEIGNFNPAAIATSRFAGASPGTAFGIFAELILDPNNIVAESNEDESDNTRPDKYIYVEPDP